MFRDFEMTFTGKCREYIREVYRHSRTIVEYGTGGSTRYAAELGKTVLAVESSNQWLLELVASIAERRLPGTIVPLHVDIGDTGAWGFPVNQSKIKQWPQYATKPWIYCNEHGIKPEIVLIDGRFRVACFIATCLAIQQPTTVLFDDFVGRPYYHMILDVVPATRHVDDRLAVFEIEPGRLQPHWLLRHLGSFLDCR